MTSNLFPASFPSLSPPFGLQPLFPGLPPPSACHAFAALTFFFPQVSTTDFYLFVAWPSLVSAVSAFPLSAEPLTGSGKLFSTVPRLHGQTQQNKKTPAQWQDLGQMCCFPHPGGAGRLAASPPCAPAAFPSVPLRCHGSPPVPPAWERGAAVPGGAVTHEELPKHKYRP